jgi:hypothetical protein
MRSVLRHLFNPLPRRPQPRRQRGGAAPDAFFADPAVVEDDYRRMRRAPRD